MPEKKLIIPFLLIAGAAAVAYGMLMKNNFIFIAGIILVAAGYCLIRKDLKRLLSRQQDADTPDTPASSDEE